MSKTIRVQVTPEDIEAGVPNDAELCPVARSLRRTLGMDVLVTRARDAYGHWVGVAEIETSIGEARVRLPRSVGEFTARFDHDYEGEPFAFRVVR